MVVVLIEEEVTEQVWYQSDKSLSPSHDYVDIQKFDTLFLVISDIYFKGTDMNVKCAWKLLMK
jgi:hypothetical protein